MKPKTILFQVISVLCIASICAKSRETLKICRNEQHRPQIHFSPGQGWNNDPNGMVYYDGEYHLHFQYHPNGTQWGPMHWGHAISTDLVHWTEIDISLAPDELGTIFSGSAVVDSDNTTGFQETDEKPIVAMFTHHREDSERHQQQQQSIAYSLDKGRTFTKYSGNPVIANEWNIHNDFRDPKVVRINDEWIVVLAVGQRIMFYKSLDLKSWTYLSDFGDGQGSHGGVWECPDLFSLTINGQIYWILLVSINPGGPNGGSITQYFVGQWTDNRFVSSQIDPLWLDWGTDNYAGVTFFADPSNRVNYMGWMNNWAYAGNIPTGNYRGQMTLPRILILQDVPDVGLRLASSFAQELVQLRNHQQRYDTIGLEEIPANGVKVLELGFENPLMEIELAFSIQGIRGPSSIAVCLLNSLQQELCFGYDHNRAKGTEIFLNREKTGNLNCMGPNFYPRPVSGRESTSSELTFKALVDVSAIELLVDNGLTAMTVLFYPDEPLTRVEVRHHASGNDDSRVVLSRASVQGLNSIYDCPGVESTGTKYSPVVAVFLVTFCLSFLTST